MGRILLHPLGSYSNRGTRDVVVKQQIQPPSLEAYCLDGRQRINRNPKRLHIIERGAGDTRERLPGGTI